MKEKNKKQAIFQCALTLFAEKGYEAVSPNDIVEAVGVTKPTLYYFFGNKEGLLDEILKTHYQKLDELLIKCCVYLPNIANYQEDVYPVLLGIVKNLFQFSQEYTAFYLMSLSISFAPQSSKTAIVSEPYHKTHYLILEQLFKDISDIHQNLKGKEQIYSWRFLSYINAQIGFWHRGYGDLSHETAEAIVTGFMHGIFS